MKKNKTKNNCDIPGLIKSNYLFNFILSKINAEVLIINSKGTINYANSLAVKALGRSKNDVVGKNIIKFIHPKISKEKWHRTHFCALKKKNAPASYMIERIVKDGSIQIIDISAVYFKYGGREHILSSSKNITEKMKLEEKLAESENLFRFFTEQAADAIFTVDLNGHILYANKAAEKIIKIPLSFSKGMHFVEFISEKSKLFARRVFQKVKKGEPVILGQMDIVDKHGKDIPIEFTSTPIFKDGKVFQLHTIFRDIRGKKELDFLLRQSEKNEAIKQFIAGTSQEVQGPLRGMLENTERLITKYEHRDYEYIGYKEFKDIIKTLEHMRDQIKYCCDTSNRLLTISKRRAGLKIDNCNAGVVIKGVINNLKPTIEISDIKISLKIPKKLPFVAIGSVELNQIITNMLTNSIQAISNKGIIEIKAFYSHDEDLVLITIKDNGVGIPREILPKIYDPFFTTKSRGLEKNSGLGLSIVYSIIKSVKGDILVDSSVKNGTKVQIKIPVYKNGRK